MVRCLDPEMSNQVRLFHWKTYPEKMSSYTHLKNTFSCLRYMALSLQKGLDYPGFQGLRLQLQKCVRSKEKSKK